MNDSRLLYAMVSMCTGTAPIMSPLRRVSGGMRDITFKDGFAGRYLYPPAVETLLYARDSLTVYLQTHNDRGLRGTGAFNL